jgi:hypothetical protein
MSVSTSSPRPPSVTTTGSEFCQAPCAIRASAPPPWGICATQCGVGLADRGAAGRIGHCIDAPQTPRVIAKEWRPQSKLRVSPIGVSHKDQAQHDGSNPRQDLGAPTGRRSGWSGSHGTPPASPAPAKPGGLGTAGDAFSFKGFRPKRPPRTPCAAIFSRPSPPSWRSTSARRAISAVARRHPTLVHAGKADLLLRTERCVQPTCAAPVRIRTDVSFHRDVGGTESGRSRRPALGKWRGGLKHLQTCRVSFPERPIDPPL